MKRILLIAAAFIFLSYVPALARTTHYVSQAGSGSADGSSAENAWSIATFNDTYPFTTICGAGANQVKAGDTVYFSGNLDSTINARCGGTGEETRIVYDFSGSTFIDTTNAVKLALCGNDYITIRNFTVKTAYSQPTVIVRLSTGGTDGQSRYVIVEGGASNDSVSPIVDIGYSEYTIVRNNSFINNQEGIIYAGCGGKSAPYNTIQNNTLSSKIDAVYENDLDLMQFGCIDNLTVDGNTLKFQHRTWYEAGDPHNDMFQIFKCVDTGKQPSEITVKNNYFLMAAYGDNKDSFTMQTGLAGNHYWYNNIFVAGNVLHGGYQAGLGFSCENDNCKLYIYNNTFYLTSSDYGNMLGAVNSDNWTSEFHAKNNIFYSESGGSSLFQEGFSDCSNATLDADNNYFAGGNENIIKTTYCGGSTQKVYGSCADLKTAGILKSNNICGSADPFASKVEGGFRLTPQSQPVDAGATIGSPYNTDKSGTSRPQGAAWDIGAYEYDPGKKINIGAGGTITLGGAGTITLQ